ncbi:MAG: ribonuclease HII [Clostridia bacterium]
MDYSSMNAKAINTYLDTLEIDALEKEMPILKSSARSTVLKLVTKYNNRIEKHYRELERIKQLYRFEEQLYRQGLQYIAGVDEAGRGPLAGSVFAAAVILKPGTIIKGINDSKKLSEAKREEIFKEIIEKAEYYNVASVTGEEIDEINIRNAAFKAMGKAVQGLDILPQFVLIDGDDVKEMNIQHQCIVKGDSLSISIAAASILAKVSRDRYIREYDKIYPQYGFASHKGYGTKEHIDSIKKFGLCPIHRRSFTSKFINV